MTTQKAEPQTLRPRHVKGWLIGLLVAAVGATLTDVATGGISAGLKSGWRAVAGHSDPAPLTVSARVQHNRRSSFVFAKRFSALPPPPRDDLSDEARIEWAQRNGGIDATTSIQVIVEGQSVKPVVLLGLDIEIVERRPPPTGTFVGGSGAGGIGVRYFEVDLDQPRPTPKIGTLDEQQPGQEPIDFPYRISRTDPEVFVVYGLTERCDCRWTAKLHWVSDGEERTTAIREDDKPFRTASAQAARDTLSPDESGRLRPFSR